MSKPRLLTLYGKTMNVVQWEKQTGLSRGTINYRLNAGWPIERALTSPLVSAGRPKKRLKQVPFPPFKDLEREHLAIMRQLNVALRMYVRVSERQMDAICRGLTDRMAQDNDAAANEASKTTRGVGRNLAKKPKDRTHSTSRETT